MRIHQVIEEIRNKMDQPPHRAAQDVHALLENHRALLQDCVDREDLRVLMADLELLGETRPVNYGTDAFARETAGVLSRLRFILDRVI